MISGRSGQERLSSRKWREAGRFGCDVRKMCVEPADSFTSAEEEEEEEEEEEGVGRGKLGSVGLGVWDGMDGGWGGGAGGRRSLMSDWL